MLPLASLGEPPGCAPSQPLRACAAAAHGKLEKVLDFIARTKPISVIKALLVLNPKHSSYWEEN